METFIESRYFEFIDELDPFRDKEEDPDNLEDMLYNLLCIKEDADAWSEDEPELYETLLAIIEQFKAAGVKII